MDMNESLVSIAMATYNGAKYLHEQINSIIDQTYKNIEIVIVDDGSSDGTADIIRGYQAKFPFIHLHLNEKNAGVTNSFARAISLCKGDYVALSDQDDYWLPHKIETLVKNIGDHDAIFSNSLLVNEKGESLGRSFTSLMNMKSYYNGAPFLLSNSVPGHTILVKTRFVKSLLPFPSHVYFDLWIGFNAASCNGIKFVNEVLVHYRQHESNAVGTSMSKNARVKRSVQQQFNAKKFELETLAKAPIKDERTKKILHEMIRFFHRRWSFKRSAFFFRNYNDLLLSKQKPGWRKKLFCVKMFFKPNF